MNRECDPDVCGPCGSIYALCGEGQDEWVNCGNVRLQQGQRAAVRVGLSPIAGFGLFAGEDIDKGAMIGEYVGELIENGEADKRAMINEECHRNYLFGINQIWLIDGATYGNTLRYLNNASAGRANCSAQIMYVLGNHRVAISATRRIRRHEELLFDYGEQFKLPDRPDISGGR